MTARVYVWLGSIIAMSVFASAVHAQSDTGSPVQTQLSHVVQQGESWGAIAERYYGEPEFEKFIVEDNGLKQTEGPVAGLRIHIPLVLSYKVEAHDTWASIAARYYGDNSRAFVLAENNRASGGEKPLPGEIISIPYPLRHTAEPHETLSKISQRYYQTNARARMLQKFNHMRTPRANRGQVLLVPLTNLQLSDSGKKLLEEKSATKASEPAIDSLMQSLAVVREHVQRGNYIDAVALSCQMLGKLDAAKHPLEASNIETELAIAYVALNREDLAVKAFQEARKHNANLRLDPIASSPRVRHALELAIKASAR